MVVLELYILVDGQNIVEHAFYNTSKEVKINKEVRDNLMNAIVSLSANAFNDEIKNFSLGDYFIIVDNNEIEEPINPDKKIPVQMYVIAENVNGDKLKIQKLMHEAMAQFLNRYSRVDILEKNKNLFVDFSPRFNKIFKNVVEASFASSLNLDKVRHTAKQEKRMQEMKYNLSGQFN
jgi:hypothetical protein